MEEGEVIKFLAGILGVAGIAFYFYLVFIKSEKIRNSRYWFWGWLGSLFLVLESFNCIAYAGWFG